MTGPPDPDGLHADQVTARTVHICGADVETEVVHLGPGGWKWAIHFYAFDNPKVISSNGWAVIGAIGPFLKQRANGLGHVSTSNKHLAAVLGWGRGRVIRTLAELEAVGVIERREKGKGRRGSLYALTCPQPWATKGKDERQAEADAGGDAERSRQAGQAETAAPLGRIIREIIEQLHQPDAVISGRSKTAEDALASDLKEVWQLQPSDTGPTAVAALGEMILAHERFTLMVHRCGFEVWNGEIDNGNGDGEALAARFAAAAETIATLPGRESDDATAFTLEPHDRVEIVPWIFGGMSVSDLMEGGCTDAADFRRYEAGGRAVPLLEHPDLGKWARHATANIAKVHHLVEVHMADIVSADYELMTGQPAPF